MNDDDVVYFFNNCKGRDHVYHYGPDAYFDLNIYGRHTTQAIDLPIGQECVVASRADDGQIIFNWYTFESQAYTLDKNNWPARVFYGDFLATETLPKSKAANSKRYSQFFNVNGHFKRPSVTVAHLPRRYRLRPKQKRATYCPEEVDVVEGPFLEGATRRITVNAYERNAAARLECLRHHGTKCCICNFDFGLSYGPDAKDFIHVHHLKPLSELKASYKINPKRDLRPVCPNCHAVLHLGGTLRSINEVKAMLRSKPKRKK